MTALKSWETWRALNNQLAGSSTGWKLSFPGGNVYHAAGLRDSAAFSLRDFFFQFNIGEEGKERM